MLKPIGVLLSGALLMLTGCSSMVPADKDAKRVFVYDYQVPSAEEDELWVRARDYFATTYGDSRSVIRVQDREEATVIGKGVASWQLIGSSRCYTDYHLKFMSKAGKARLQLEIIEGVPANSTCSGWSWPTQSGYEEIVSEFESLSSGLEAALEKKSAFSDF